MDHTIGAGRLQPEPDGTVPAAEVEDQPPRLVLRSGERPQQQARPDVHLMAAEEILGDLQLEPAARQAERHGLLEMRVHEVRPMASGEQRPYHYR